MTIKAVIFDLDGVITDTEKFHFEAWEKAFAPYGIKLTSDIYQKSIQSRARYESIKNILGDVPEEVIKQISDNKAREYQELTKNNLEAFEDAIVFINFLKEKKVPMAVASSSSIAKDLVERLGLIDFFVRVWSGKDITKNKPDPEIFEKAINGLQKNPEECLVIEDSFSGMEAAKRAGAPFVALFRQGELPYVEGALLTVSHLMDEKLLELFN